MPRNKVKMQALNSRVRAANSADANGFRVLMGQTAGLVCMSAGLHRHSAPQNFDMDSGASVTNPFHGHAELLSREVGA